MQGFSVLNLSMYSGLTLIFLLLLLIGSAKVLQTLSLEYIEDAANTWKHLMEAFRRRVSWEGSQLTHTKTLNSKILQLTEGISPPIG